MTSWIVQTNLIKEELYPAIEIAANRNGHGCVGLKIIPFSDSPEFLADIGFKPPEGKLIPYGSTSMIKMFARSKWNKDGFFFNQENLRSSVWAEKLGRLMLNYDAFSMPLKDAIKMKGLGTVFMKPDNDLKDFTGGLVDGNSIAKFYDEVSAGGFCFDTDIPVVLCSPKNTGWEYRLFMIKNKAVAFSSYKLKDMIRQDKFVPQKVIDFAQSVATIWRPDEAYVMDVCETDDELKIVEFNCINASGFYRCNVEKIVRELSEYVEGTPHPCCTYAGPPFVKCFKCGGRSSL